MDFVEQHRSSTERGRVDLAPEAIEIIGEFKELAGDKAAEVICSAFHHGGVFSGIHWR
jgi:hypothetical protein